MKVVLVPIAVMAGMVSGPVLAQSMDSPFTGPRVEFFGGYNRVLPSLKTIGANPSTSGIPKHTGGIAGLEAGYDMAAGPVVVGVFGSAAFQTPNSCGTLAGTNYGCLRPGRQLAAGARVGFAVQPNILVYAKGAYVNTSVRTAVLVAPGQYDTSHINEDGWRAGGGAEYALNSHFYLKAEYDYTRTRRFNVAPYGFFNSSLNLHQHSVLGGFGVRF